MSRVRSASDVWFVAIAVLTLAGAGALAYFWGDLFPQKKSIETGTVKAKNEADAIKSLYGKTAVASDKIKLDAPEIAENGAVVPVSVSTTLADVTSISFLVAENPVALIASYKIPAGTVPTVANRIKMAKTSNVIVLVEAGGKLYSAAKEVKVTVGGCGG